MSSWVSGQCSHVIQFSIYINVLMCNLSEINTLLLLLVLPLVLSSFFSLSSSSSVTVTMSLQYSVFFPCSNSRYTLMSSNKSSRSVMVKPWIQKIREINAWASFLCQSLIWEISLHRDRCLFIFKSQSSGKLIWLVISQLWVQSCQSQQRLPLVL